jgi:uncharacterized repeat protein (TIGR04138 family)
VTGFEFWTAVERIRALDGRYGRDAYVFVMESLEFTIEQVGERRHVGAGELLDGLCAYARRRFGLLALTVLASWGIVESGDVGEIVFQLIDAGILSRQDGDARADFDGACDFQRILDDGYFEAGG